MRMCRGTVYLVHWIDTFVPDNNGWTDIESIRKQAKASSKYLHSVGFYIGHFHGYDVLAAEFNEKPHRLNWGGLTFIPRGCIQEIEKLA